ncbi:MAG TPA: glycosyltransferase family protein [Thermoanaerobaculia bacterium]|nr:glycosyltransferase family protein [Thermoanaerobaculia bacterium]
MKVLVVVQARTGSTRLPGKVLLPVAGAPLLVRMLERVRAARTPTEVVVATTTDAADQPVRDLARQAGVRCFSGHPTDLLDRHYQAALACGLSPAAAESGSRGELGSAGDGSAGAGGGDVVVKIPSDCPLIDPAVIDRVIGCHLEQPERYDFVSNLHPATYPDGNDVEVMPLAVLETAWREATRPHEREHTTPFLWDQPRRFRLGNVCWETGRDLSMSHRFTVDYPEDYAFVSAVFDALWTSDPPREFGLNEILGLLAARPDIFELNRRYAGVNWYRNHLGDLATVGAGETRRPEEAT